MSLSITFTAIARPNQQAAALIHSRQLNLLYDLLERKLIWVFAPADAGKHPRCWFDLSKGSACLLRTFEQYDYNFGAFWRIFTRRFLQRSRSWVGSLKNIS